MLGILKKKFFEEITCLGGVGFYISLITLFFVLGRTDYVFKLIVALLIIYFLTFVIRVFYFKARPNKQIYKNFIERLDASSFPSVHAARATFISFFLIFSFLPNFFYTLLILVLWAVVLHSRVYLNKHYLIDVIAGILLGIFSLIVCLI